MHESMFNSGWETALLAAPFLVMLIAGVFRLDELLVTQKAVPKRQRHFAGASRNGEIMLYDPDGRPSYATNYPLKSRK